MDMYDIKSELLKQCAQYKQMSHNVTVSILGVRPDRILEALDQLESEGKIDYRYSGTTYIDGSILLDYLRFVPQD